MQLFDKTTYKVSRVITNTYSTSFSFATGLLSKEHRNAIYAIYGFVRFADEIVDTFHHHDKKFLLQRFEQDLQLAIKQNVSLNPVLHAFQLVIHKFNIPYEEVDSFLTSMKFDLEKKEYRTRKEASEYIYGSADVVGLMCLRVFCDGNENYYNELKGPAMRLGSAFQKVNFLRDLKNDAEFLGRTYFPDLNYQDFNEETKSKIVADIEDDFREAYSGIKKLPTDSKVAVMVAYLYYRNLLKKLKHTPASKIKEVRIRISNTRKIIILIKAVLLGKLKLI